MSVTVPVTTDSLPSNVPKLDVKGTNWAIFAFRFQVAVEAKDLWKQFDGSTPQPVAATTSPLTETETAANALWRKHESQAKNLLTQRIPDSTVLRIRNITTVHAMWTEIVREYTEKGAYAQTDLRTQFLELKLPKGGDVRQFLDGLRTKREELASVGVAIDEKDYRSTIIKSLPDSLANFASNQLTSARLWSPTKTIDPDILISVIAEESERQRAKRPSRENAKEHDRDEAMAITGSAKPNGRAGAKRGGRKQRGNCWNCGSDKHYKDKCPEPPKDRSPTGGGQAHAVDDTDSEDGVFGVSDLSDVESIPDLMSVESSVEGQSDGAGVDEDGDCFSEVGDESPWGCGWEGEELARSDTSDMESFVDINLSPVANTDREPTDVAAEVSNELRDASTIELYDSGTTRHISPYLDKFDSLSDIPPKPFTAANKQKFNAVGVGEMVIEVPNGVDASKLRLTEVLYSPEVGYTLVSIGRLDELGFSTTFADGHCTIRNPDGDVIGQIPRSTKGLYRVVHEQDSVSAATEMITVMELHRRMGHIAPSAARRFAEKGLVSGLKVNTSSDELTFCESCVYAKATRKPIAKVREGERAKEVGGLVFSDLWGPAPVATLGGRKYYVTFTDDKTRLTYLHLLRQKSETFDAYKQFEAWCDRQLAVKIKVLHSDRGGEYLGKEFVLYLKTSGTTQRLTTHDTPQHNGVAERLNRTLLEKVRAMLHESALPKFLWGEAVRHAVWLKNRTPTKALDGLTPYEAAMGKKPDLRNLRTWGSRVWVRTESGNKLTGHVDEGRWMGIDDQTENGCRVYWPTKRRVSIERNIYFDDSVPASSHFEGEEGNLPGEITLTQQPIPAMPSTVPFSSVPPSVKQAPSPLVPLPPLVEPEPNPSPDPPAKRIRKPSQRILDIIAGKATSSPRPSDPPIPRGVQMPTIIKEQVTLEGEGTAEQMLATMEEDEAHEVAMLISEVISEAEALEPSSLAEAKRRPDWPQWEQGIREELATLQNAGTWELADLPEGANLVGSKWVFRAKKDAAGNIVRYKARLVAQGFSQVPGVDYFDTYAPVAKLASIRTVLALSARQDLELHQVDIKGAYLNGELTNDEIIYMRQPPGFFSTEHPRKVCRLRKTLYGLKQSGRRWYQKLVEILVDQLGFKQCDVDQAVFLRRNGEDMEIVVVHVDDCTIAATTVDLITKLKGQFREYVEITDLGELHWLLGIEVTRDRDARTISLSQKSYIDSIIRRFNFDELKPVSSPMEPHVKLTTTQSPSTSAEYAAMRHIPYREAVGSLMYAALGTRPDISYAVTTVSRFSSNPGMPHWEAVRRIYRYLIGTKDLRLTYGGIENVLTGYADADGSMAEDRRAVSGYAFMIDGGAVSWSSKRQEIVSLSTTESEYVAATHAAKEALWLRSLITQLFFPLSDPTTLFSDNQSAIALAKDHQYHARTKHIDVRFHFIRWIIDDGKLRLIFCPTADMIADTFTKALPSPKVKHFATELGLRTA